MTQPGASHTGDPERVVLTGVGLVTPLGVDVDHVWSALCEGRSGIAPLRLFPTAGFPVHIGGEVDSSLLAPDPALDAGLWRCNRTLRYAAWAADRAWEQAGLDGGFDPHRAAVVVGAGVFPAAEDRLTTAGVDLRASRPAEWLLAACRREPALLSQVDLAAVSSLLSRRRGLAGPSLTVQAACTSGTQAIAEAFYMIRERRADVVLTGGADSMLSALCVTGFSALQALSRNPDPARASRPFDALRDGFVMAEGAGMLVLESLGHAARRGARIVGEVIGYGASGDAWRFTDLHPEGEGAVRCMRASLADAGISPAQVDYVNAHGTSTPLNDRIETAAIHQVFGAHAPRLAVSATKSQLGHLICAAGAVECVVTALALERGVIPPTINLDHPDPACDLDYVPHEARRASLRVAISNSFGFGGQNGTLVLRRWEG